MRQHEIQDLLLYIGGIFWHQDVIEEIPLLDMLDGRARRQLGQRAERLDFQHVTIGENLRVDAAIGIGRARIALEDLDEEMAGARVGHPALIHPEAGLLRRLRVGILRSIAKRVPHVQRGSARSV